jgi:hypothetical protein
VDPAVLKTGCHNNQNYEIKQGEQDGVEILLAK